MMLPDEASEYLRFTGAPLEMFRLRHRGTWAGNTFSRERGRASAYALTLALSAGHRSGSARLIG
jgi:hypothetical protein